MLSLEPRLPLSTTCLSFGGSCSIILLDPNGLPTFENSATAFSGFGDDESGFYQTFERAFREVWDSERDWGEVSSGNSKGAGSGIVWGKGEPPSMGGSKDSYETADRFYGSWSSFVSVLSFGWVDEYNVNEVSVLFYPILSTCACFVFISL